MAPRVDIVVAAVLACCFSATAGAAEPLLGQAARTFGALVFVLVLMAVLAWATRRLRSRGGFMSGTRLRLVESLPLGMRDKLLLVEVDGKSCLIGVSQSGIRSLAVGGCTHCDSEEASFGQQLEHSRAELAERA